MTELDAREDGHHRVRDLLHRVHRGLAAQVAHRLRLENVRHEDAEHDHKRLEEDEAQDDRDHPRLQDRRLRLLRRAVAGECAAIRDEEDDERPEASPVDAPAEEDRRELPLTARDTPGSALVAQ